MDEKNYIAVVEKVVPDGNHGPYAAASNEDLGLITFSLKPSVWKEKSWPEGGNIVVLSEVNKKRAGWRANSGRFFRPSDENPLRTGSTRNRKEHQNESEENRNR